MEKIKKEQNKRIVGGKSNLVKVPEDYLDEKNWEIPSHSEANQIAFHYAIAYPEFKFGVIKRGDGFLVTIKKSKKG